MNSRTARRMWQSRNKQRFTDKKSALFQADFFVLYTREEVPPAGELRRLFCRRVLQGLGKTVDKSVFVVGAYLG